MTNESLKLYKRCAEKINWKQYNINELFFKYIEHENDPDGQNYYAGIICRTWGYTARLYKQCAGNLSFDNCYNILMDAINYVIKKRVWENEESSLYNDPTAPDKAFHVALKRQRGLLLAKLNATKRRTNFNALSIDEIHESYSDAADGLFDIADDTDNMMDIDMLEMIKARPIKDIILLDTVCFRKWSKLQNVVTFVKKLEAEHSLYFSGFYNLDDDQCKRAIFELHRASSDEVLSYLKKLLYSMRGEMSR